MARSYFLPAIVVLLCGMAFGQLNSRLIVEFDESKLSFHLLPETRLDFALRNNSDHALRGTVWLEILDSHFEGKVQAKQVYPFELAPGNHLETLKWDLKSLPTPNPIFLGTYRLRYTVTPQQDGEFGPVSGIVQLGPKIEDGFAIQGFPGGQFHCAADCRFWVRVAEPNSGHPWEGVEVEAVVTVGNKEHTIIKQTAITDSDGHAAMHLDPPASRSSSFGHLELDAYRGPFKVGRGGSIGWAQPARITLTTDKPIYQPRQSVHMRVLVFGFDGRAWENAKVILKITNHSEQEQFRETLVTSKFGVAPADWPIPEKTSLDDYSIEAKVDDPSSAESRANIRIGRYDLPTFTVKVVPDRSFYLPGQDATLHVSGEYLFGKHVTHGKVRVTEEGNNGALSEGEQVPHWRWDSFWARGLRTQGKHDAKLQTQHNRSKRRWSWLLASTRNNIECSIE